MALHRASRLPRRPAGQAIIEYLVIGAVVIAALLLLRDPLGQAMEGVFGQSASTVDRTGLAMARLTPEMPSWGGRGVQEPPRAPAPDGAVAEAPGAPGRVPKAPGQPGADQPDQPPPEDTIGGTSPRRGGGGGGGSGVAGGTPSSIPSPDLPAPPAGPSASDVGATEPGAQQSLIDAAKGLLAQSTAVFTLFDFDQGQSVTHAIGEIVDAILGHQVPMLVGDLSQYGALAAVFFEVTSAGLFDPSKPVELVFDTGFLATATVEAVAAVMAHEGWHVRQVFSGIIDDFTNYPRVVDIEYEAFVAGAAVWDAHNGGQSEPTLDAGSACVAAGEARCKEILATDFGYPTGPRG